MTDVLAYSNALTRTLAHYETELGETLERCGVETVRNDVVTIEDPHGICGRLDMLLDAIRNDTRFRSRSDVNLQIWPSLGLIEALLWRSSRRRNLLMIHDPVPLRRQIGYGPLSAMVARRWFPTSSAAPTIIVHSGDAEQQVRQLLPHRVWKVMHPVLSRMRSTKKTERPSVIVAGQNKIVRDLHVLGAIGPRLRREGVELKILGRGWPSELPGWDVDSRFIPESEFDQALGEAWVVLLPYRRYYQSGVALRALENGTLAVSPRTSFAEDLLESHPNHIVDPPYSEDRWLAAIADAFETVQCRDEVGDSFASYRERCDASWKALMVQEEADRYSGASE